MLQNTLIDLTVTLSISEPRARQSPVFWHKSSFNSTQGIRTVSDYSYIKNAMASLERSTIMQRKHRNKSGKRMLFSTGPSNHSLYRYHIPSLFTWEGVDVHAPIVNVAIHGDVVRTIMGPPSWCRLLLLASSVWRCLQNSMAIVRPLLYIIAALMSSIEMTLEYH